MLMRMPIPAWISLLVRWIAMLTLPFVLLVTPLHLFARPGYVRHEYSLRSFPPAERFDNSERARLSDTIVRYIRGWASLEEMRGMRTSAGEVALNDREVQHLVDVRVVLEGFFGAHWVSVALLAISVVVLWYSRRTWMSAALRQGIWITGGVIVFIVAASFIDFDVFFTRFHELFFTGESWLFYVTDTLIQLYPLPLWIDAVWKIGVAVLAEAGVVYALSAGIERLVRGARGSG